IHSMSAPRLATSSIIVSTSRIRGTFDNVTSSPASRVAARIGSAPFLLPAARIRPRSGVPPSMTNASGTAGATAMTGYPSQPHGQDSRTSLGHDYEVHEEPVPAAA